MSLTPKADRLGRKANELCPDRQKRRALNGRRLLYQEGRASEKKRDEARDIYEASRRGDIAPPCPRAYARPYKPRLPNLCTARGDRGDTPGGTLLVKQGIGRVHTENMAKKMLIDATHAEETRVVVVDGNKVEEFDFESENKRQLAGNIYLAKVTRVEPSLQAAFVDYGGNRHGFLAFSEIHPDYYQIPVADRQALMEEEAALAAAAAEEDEEREKPKRSRSRSRRKPKTSDTKPDEAKDEPVAIPAPEAAAEQPAAPKSSDAPREISGMETIDLDDGDDTEAGEPGEGLSPMETVHEVPVAEPIDSVEGVESEEVSEAAPAEEAEPEAVAVEEVTETPVVAEVEAPVAEEPTQEAVAEVSPVDDTVVAAVDQPAEAETSDEADTPKRPIAADSDDKPVIVSADPSEVNDTPAADEPVAETSPETVADTGEAAEAASDVSADPVEDAPIADTAEAVAPTEAEAQTDDVVVDTEAAPEAEQAPDSEGQTAQPEVSDTLVEDTPVEDAVEKPAEPEVSEQAADAAVAPKADAKAEDERKDAAETPDAAAATGDEDDKPKAKAKASDRDASIESVADDDTEEEIRPRRKPRPRRYKIQEVIKVRQILLVQVVKEERGNKGAALTTYLSLAGRYCVLMPNTARGGGISRKITNAADRSKLKSIANEIDVPKGAGLIIRTAGAKRTKTEIKRDYEYLQRLWEQIRELTLKSTAPAKIYEEGDLIKRSIRDLYNREIDEVFVEGERGYRIAKDFMKMIMPSHAKNVKNYNEAMPLFARYQVESYLGGMFNPTVQLKSGGYIVIGVTEALVAIDVNSGRATKEGSIEDTATKTNLEAAEEVARQLRLRDLAGLIVIDFIDMDERKNNAAVEKRIKDKLKTDRARIQVGRISGFGLMEMSRQRLRPGMIEATTQPCPACHGTGLIRSDDNMALQVLRQIEEEGVRRRSREVLVKCPVSIANYLMNQKREHIAQIETRYGMSVRIEGDPHLVAPDFSMEKFKVATRVVPVATAPVVSVDTSLMDMIDEEAEADAIEDAEVIERTEKPEATETGEDGQPKKRRRRRRRKSSKSREEGGEGMDAEKPAEDKPEGEVQDAGEVKTDGEAAPVDGSEGEEKPKKRRTRRSRSRKKSTETGEVKGDEAASEADAKAAEDAPAETASKDATADTSDAKAEVVAEAPEAQADAPAKEPVAVEPEVAPTPEAPQADVVDTTDAKPKRARTRRKASDVIASVVSASEPVAQDAAKDGETSVEAQPEAAASEAPAEPAAETAPVAEPASPAGDASQEAKPKRRGWWSLGR